MSTIEMPGVDSAKVFLCKISPDYAPEQLEGDYIAAGPRGERYYGDLKEGDWVFPIFDGKVSKLWQMVGYANGDKSKIEYAEFRIVRRYFPPLDLKSDFVPFVGFELDIVLLNKAIKSTRGYGFHEIKLEEHYEVEHLPSWNIAGSKRRLVLMTRKYLNAHIKEEKWSLGDIVLMFDDDLVGGEPEVFSENGKFAPYTPLLSKNKVISNARDLNELLRLSQGRKQKHSFLAQVVSDLKSKGIYEIKKNPVALYDHVLSFKSLNLPEIERYWAIPLRGQGGEKVIVGANPGARVGFDLEDYGLSTPPTNLIGSINGRLAVVYDFTSSGVIRIALIGRIDLALESKSDIEITVSDPSRSDITYRPHGDIWFKSNHIFEVPQEDTIPIFNSESPKSVITRDLNIKGDLGKMRLEMPPALGVESLAEEMAKVLNQLENEPGMMVGIFGRWGRGKTFLVEQIKKHIESKKQPFKYIKFNAWHYQDTPASWAYLYEEIAEVYLKTDSVKWYTRQFRKIWLNINRDPNHLIWFGLSLIGAFLWLGPLKATIDLAVLWGLLTIAPVALILKLYAFAKPTAKDLFAKYTGRKSFEHLLGFQAEIQKELRLLLKQWIGEKSKERILLFVDDIDRCSEDRIIQIVDALRLMVDDPEVAKRVVVIAAIDEHILSNAIRHKYKHLLQEEVTDDALRLRVREYLDKLFIFGIKLNPLNPLEKSAILHSIVKGKVSELSPEFELQAPLNVTAEAPSFDGAETNNPADDSEEEDPDVDDSSTMGVLRAPNKLIQAPPMNEGEELRSSELKALESGIAQLSQGSPRQLRIYYYRYLLARNLLHQRLVGMGNETILSLWNHNLAHTDFLALFVACYSENPVQVSKSIRSWLKDKTKSDELRIYDKAFSCDPKLLEELLGIVEVVVAY